MARLLGYPLEHSVSGYALLSWGVVIVAAVVAASHDPHGILKASTSNTARSSGLRVDAIYQFGDSISDTGNDIRENRTGLCTSFPYGESYFHYATGRCSNGLIMVDYYAKAFGLELLNPYLEKGANFRDGVVFSVAGATALDVAFLQTKNFKTGGTNSSLSVQVNWFREYLKYICSSTAECRNKLKRAVFLMEAIGGNDYDYVFQQDLSFQVAYELVPDVIRVIIEAVQNMIVLGATNVVVPALVPFGCMPGYLASVNSTDRDLYDELGCLIDFNKLAEFHNDQLYKATQHLQTLYPTANLIYADYYLAITTVLQNAASLGFDEDAILTACCGSGKNPYNFNLSEFCGTVGVPVCPNPDERVSWDGIHFTQQLYKYVSGWMLKQTIIPRLVNNESLQFY